MTKRSEGPEVGGSRRIAVRGLAYVASAATLFGSVLLLLADDAGPQCNKATLDLRYDVSTTCFVVASGRVHVTTTADSSWFSPAVTIELGDLNLEDVQVVAAECKKDGQSQVPGKINLTVAKVAPATGDAAAQGGSGGGSSGLVPYPSVLDRRYCSVRVPSELGTDVVCSEDSAGSVPATCTVRLVQVSN
jgi:hypothetical protein